MTTITRLRTVWCLLLLFITGPTYAQPVQDRLQAVLVAFHERGEFPGATIGYVLPDATSGSVSVGFAFKETQTPMTARHRMMAGSTGKTFFATLALKLVEEGVLDLDVKISKWLEDEEWFPRLPNAQYITLRMLMNHTSGIPRYVMLPAFVEAMMDDPDRRVTPLQTLEFIFDAEPLLPAGEGWGSMSFPNPQSPVPSAQCLPNNSSPTPRAGGFRPRRRDTFPVRACLRPALPGEYSGSTH